MTGSQWFCIYRQTARKVKKNQVNLLGSCSFTENSIEWKIKQKKKVSMHFHFTTYHCKSFCWIGLWYLLISWKFARITAFPSLHVERCSDEESVKDKWDFGFSWNCCKVKVLMMLSPSVKTKYLEIF